MASDEITQRLRSPECLRQYFQATGREYSTAKNCKCPNPSHNDKDPSAHVYENAGGAFVKCFGCNENFDIFALYGIDHGTDTKTPDGFKAAKQALCAMFGIDQPGTGPRTSGGAKPSAASTAITRSGSGPTATGSAKAAADRKPDAKPDKATSDHLTKCALTLQAGADGEIGRAYLKGRGISLETARRFNVGYDAQAGWEQGKRGGVVIPNGPGYTVRFLKPQTSKDGGTVKAMFLPKKPGNIPDCIEWRPPFNSKAIEEAAKSNAPVFIVEGEIDALSVEECGGVAVAVPTSGTGKIVKTVQQIGRGVYVPCMDRDEAGKKAQADLARKLKEIGGGVIVFDGAPALLMPDAPDGTHPKDANEALQKDAATFRARVADVIGRATAYAKEEQNVFGKERDGILRRRFCDIPTPKPENEDPDALIRNFALAKGEGWILAGEPGAGKSSFLMQLAFFAGAGKPFFGFDFIRPLTVFYLQTELQERKIWQAVNSFQYAARAEWHWTDEEFERAKGNVSYDVYMIGNICDDLPNFIFRQFTLCPFDLLIIDPLLTFARDDLSLQKVASEFLYDKMNAVMGGRKYRTPDGTPVKFGTIIAHHMGKPRTDNGKKVDRGQFSTAGSFAINAWTRFQMNLSRYAGGVYELLAAKNPECVSWGKDESGKDVESIYIKRAARGERYWTLATKEEAEAAKSGATQKPTETDEQRKAREKRETQHAIDVITTYLQFSHPLTKSQLEEFCKKNTDPVFKGFNSYTVKNSSTYGIKKPCNIALDLILQDPLAHGVMSHTDKARNGKSVTTYGGPIPPEMKRAAQIAAEKSAATLPKAEPQATADISAEEQAEPDEDGDPYGETQF